jgi:hypothetical protein
MLLGKDRKSRGASCHLGGWIGHFKRFCDLLDQDEVSKRGKYKIEKGREAWFYLREVLIPMHS